MSQPPLPSTLRIDRLGLRNFRCFADCQADLHPRLTVLVAENGRGKTAILDAIAIALGHLVDTVTRARRSIVIDRSDARLAPGSDGGMETHLPVVIGASGQVDGMRMSWEVALAGVGKGARTTSRNARSLITAGAALRGRLDSHASGTREDAPPLPLVVFYGTGRLWGDRRMTQARRSSDSSVVGRLGGYLDCLSPSSSFKAFEAWYQRTRNEAAHGSAIAFAPDEHPMKLLAAVREAVRTVLAPTEWQSIDSDGHRLVVEHPTHGRLALSSLSDGVRNMIALVGDIAHRCVRLNPHFGEHAARMTPGVLLIDEVDMHLHPQWQQRVVGLLQQAFPAMQMVVSTHSPHVLSTVDVESIRIIRVHEGTSLFVTPTYQTRGVESADVLARIMDVDPVPPVPEALWAREYRAYVESGRHETTYAVALHRRLVGHFGADHPVMAELDTLARFQAFRRSHGSGQPDPRASSRSALGGESQSTTAVQFENEVERPAGRVHVRRKD